VRLNSLLDRRPIVVALAGPNGSGKSTFFEAYLARTGLRFVNADVLAQTLGMDPYFAAQRADTLRRELVALRESFIFETVFSDPVRDKLEFLKTAHGFGYSVVLIFIGVAGPEISGERVAMRVLQGGHDVPPGKLVERFPRTLNNLKSALLELPNVWVYDHSDLSVGYRLVAKKENGQLIKSYDSTPEWFRGLLQRS
jgi:predicted ABC-type ATPase